MSNSVGTSSLYFDLPEHLSFQKIATLMFQTGRRRLWPNSFDASGTLSWHAASEVLARPYG